MLLFVGVDQGPHRIAHTRDVGVDRRPFERRAGFARGVTESGTDVKETLQKIIANVDWNMIGELTLRPSVLEKRVKTGAVHGTASLRKATHKTQQTFMKASPVHPAPQTLVGWVPSAPSAYSRSHGM
jgi:hypothetical protein